MSLSRLQILDTVKWHYTGVGIYAPRLLIVISKTQSSRVMNNKTAVTCRCNVCIRVRQVGNADESTQ